MFVAVDSNLEVHSLFKQKASHFVIKKTGAHCYASQWTCPGGLLF